MAQHYPLTGIHDGVSIPGQVPLRLEVDHWWASQDEVHIRQRSLTILALKYVQDIEPTDPKQGHLSWYQIAGIHGLPHVSWDGSPGGTNDDYCQHANVLFATWHRPYCLLLEQRLYEVMRDIIIPQNYDAGEQDKMLLAAQSWRWPYWDFSAKKQVGDDVEDYDIPRVSCLPEVEVRTKTGVKMVRNPFYSYRPPGNRTFKDPKWGKFGIQMEPFGSGRSTVKWVRRTDTQTSRWIKGTQNNDNIKYEIQDSKASYGGNLTTDWQDIVIRTLEIKNFEDFATKERNPNSSVRNIASVESLHDNIHVLSGGTDGFRGHMGATEVAAFDPIFWLHHCNIDRLVAFWQALHPDSTWFDSDAAKIPLYPFHAKNGKPHTSKTIQNQEHLGYTYGGLETWKPEYQTGGKFDPEKLSKELKKRLNTKYASTRRAEQKAIMSRTAQQVSRVSIAAMVPLDSTAAPDIWQEIQEHKIDEPTMQEIPEVITADDYVAIASYKKFGLKGEAFSVHFFVGPVPANRPYNFSDQTTQVGLAYNFSSKLAEGDEAGCENCERQAAADIEVNDVLVLTNALLTRQKQKIRHSEDPNDYLHSMEPADVSQFLQKHLDWRITTAGGDEIDKSRDEQGEYRDPRLKAIGLKVAIAGGKAKHYADDSKLSEYGDYKILYGVTEGAESGTGATPADNLFPQNPGANV